MDYCYHFIKEKIKGVDDLYKTTGLVYSIAVIGTQFLLTTNPRYNKSQSFCGERKMYNCFNIFLEAAFHRKSSNKFHSIFLYVMIHSHTMHQQKKIHSTPRSILTHHPKQLKFSKLPPPMVVATAADLVRKQFQNMISFWKAA